MLDDCIVLKDDPLAKVSNVDRVLHLGLCRDPRAYRMLPFAAIRFLILRIPVGPGYAVASESKLSPQERISFSDEAVHENLNRLEPI